MFYHLFLFPRLLIFQGNLGIEEMRKWSTCFPTVFNTHPTQVQSGCFWQSRITSTFPTEKNSTTKLGSKREQPYSSMGCQSKSVHSRNSLLFIPLSIIRHHTSQNIQVTTPSTPNCGVHHSTPIPPSPPKSRRIVSACSLTTDLGLKTSYPCLVRKQGCEARKIPILRLENSCW